MDYLGDGLTDPTLNTEQLYGQMALVRSYEERIFELFDQGELVGTTHGYIGQEAVAAGVLNHLRESDIVVSNHRCHGHYLIRTGDVVGLLAEQMGRAGGVSGGRGGSQQLHSDNFYSNGVLGSTAPVALGMALAESRLGTEAIAVLFLGDGAWGEGVVYETLNMASLWNARLLVVVEDNGYAQTTPTALNLAGTFKARAEAFGIGSGEIESNDAEVLYSRFETLVDRVRADNRPHVEVVKTYRLNAHSKSDDDRPGDEIEMWRAKDPLEILGARIDSSTRTRLDEEARSRIEIAEKAAREMDYPTLHDGRSTT
jgi:TPP-dependent pyruvate/acetoin dehydrogenase alpha subunit